MALKAATKDKLKTFGLDVDKLIEAIKADAETDYAVPEDLTVIKTTDLETRDANNKSAGKSEGMTEGEKKGRELAAKAFKKKFNLDEALPHDVDKIVEAVNTMVAKGDAGLKEQVTLLQKDKDALATQLAAEKENSSKALFDAELLGYLPANRDNFLTETEWLNRVKSTLSFETVDGKKVVKKNGEILRDKTTQNPVAAKDAITSLFTENKWIKTPGPGGRGGGDNTPDGGGAGVKKQSQFREKWAVENAGKDVNGPEFQAALQAHAKDMKDFDWYN